MIKFVICGIEHSGTTLLSDLFRQVPQVDAGFEVGVLLGKSPRDLLTMQPFAKNILGGWKISQSDLEHCCNTDEFPEFYERLQARSGLLKKEATDLFDKTPRYLANLRACMRRMNVPFVALYKDPRAIVYSDFSRSKKADFDAWFNDYVPAKLTYMRNLYAEFEQVPAAGGRAMAISLEQICMEPRASCEAVFSHCGYEFKLDYFLLKNLRYAHTRSDSISAKIPFEYLEQFSSKQQGKISDAFRDFAKWYYE